MAKALNFNELKKKYMTVTLADKRVLMIGTPTKSVLDSFINMKDSLSGEDLGDEAIDELYEIVAKIMSHNKGGEKITKEEIEALFDFQDVIIFITSYTDFINEVVNSKN